MAGDMNGVINSIRDAIEATRREMEVERVKLDNLTKRMQMLQAAFNGLIYPGRMCYVESSTKSNTFYKVVVCDHDPALSTCECPSFTFRHEPCKHMRIVMSDSRLHNRTLGRRGRVYTDTPTGEPWPS